MRAVQSSWSTFGRSFGLTLTAALVVVGAQGPLSENAQAAGKKKPAVAQAPINGKRMIELAPVRNVHIEMPDGSFHDFGDDFRVTLGRRLNESGRYLMVELAPPLMQPMDQLTGKENAPPPDYNWPGSVVPAASVNITVEAMSFQTGSRGERMYYGFNERFRTPFNDGFSSQLNEFPLRTVTFEPNWFDRAFDERGSGAFGSRVGLDLGDGLNIDVLFAWLAVKYALYHAELRIKLEIDAPLAGKKEFRLINVKGEGYFFDIAGAYEGYSAGIRIARRDAMDQALKNAINGAYDAIDRALVGLPLTGRIDLVTQDGMILLGTGPASEVKPGVRYELVSSPGVLIEVLSSNIHGSMGKVVQGDPALAKPGEIIREATAAPALSSGIEHLGAVGQAQSAALGLTGARLPATVLEASAAIPPSTVPAAIESIDLPWSNLSRSDLTGLAPEISWWAAFAKSLSETFLLPYRIYRYFSYDQAYHADVAGGSEPTDRGDWAMQARASAWGRQIGLSGAPEMAEGKTPVTVAVIDSGVDYNHWTLHSSLWLNPSASVIDAGAGSPSSRKDYYGWDFISGDAHPYDDGYHGTEAASLVAAVAPRARIMPLKVFNPWGITSSAAIYGAFQYAVDHGAQVILCAWATRLPSQAISQGVAYAREHGVLVVAAAGDRGDLLSQIAAYPAALSKSYDNLLTVTGVTAADQLVKFSGRYANFDPELVLLSAPGEGIHVATPRGEETDDTSTSLAAAIVAGASARVVADEGPGTGPAAWIEKLRTEADPVPALAGSVRGGLRVHIRH